MGEPNLRAEYSGTSLGRMYECTEVCVEREPGEPPRSQIHVWFTARGGGGIGLDVSRTIVIHQ